MPAPKAAPQTKVAKDAVVSWAAQLWGDEAVDRFNAATDLLVKAKLIARLGG